MATAITALLCVSCVTVELILGSCGWRSSCTAMPAKKHDLRRYVRFQHVVRDVKYNASADDFCVRVKKLEEDTVLPPEKFDYVINASGHFSVPNVPEFEGFRKFNGE